MALKEKQPQTSLMELENICESGAVKFTDVASCIDSKLPSLAKTRKELGNEKLMELIIKTLNDTIGFFNNEISEQVIISLAGMIAQEYYYLNFADIMLCFKKAKNGNYGLTYGSLTGVVVMDWLAQYVGERDAFAEERSYQKHMALTSNEKERQLDGFIDRLHTQSEKKSKPKPISSNQKFNKKTNKWKIKK